MPSILFAKRSVKVAWNEVTLFVLKSVSWDPLNMMHVFSCSLYPNSAPKYMSPWLRFLAVFIPLGNCSFSACTPKARHSILCFKTALASRPGRTPGRTSTVAEGGADAGALSPLQPTRMRHARARVVDLREHRLQYRLIQRALNAPATVRGCFHVC